MAGQTTKNKQQDNVQAKAAATILERKLAQVKIGDGTYAIAPPSIATLIMLSEIASGLPKAGEVKAEDILQWVVSNAKDYSALGELAAVLVLGAKAIMEDEELGQQDGKKGISLFNRSRKTKRGTLRQEMAKKILREVSPAQLSKIIAKAFGSLEVGDFFGITTSLGAVSILTPSKEVE